MTSTSRIPNHVVIVASVLLMQRVNSFTYQQTGYWETTDCSGALFYMDSFPIFNCGQRNITYNCSPYTFNSTKYYRTVIGVADTREWAKSYYKTTDYIMMEQFDTSSDDFEEYFEGRVFLGNDSCVKMINSTSYQSAIASVYNDGSLNLKMFDDNACSITAAKKFSINSPIVADHCCYNNQYKFFSESEYTLGSGSYSGSESESHDSHSESGSSSESASAVAGEDGGSSSRLGVGVIVVIVVVALVVALGIGWLIFWWGRHSDTRKQLSFISEPSRDHRQL